MSKLQTIFGIAAIGAIVIVAYILIGRVPVPTSSDTPTPSVTVSATPTPARQANIQVTEPKAGDEVGLPLVIKGKARVFENTFSYRIRDENGSILYESNAMTEAKDSGVFGNFELKVNYPQPKGDKGAVEVFEYSAKDGSEINKVRIPVVFADDVEAMTVKVYFGSRTKDPNSAFCERSYALERRIAKTQAPARAVLEELLKGPDRIEGNKGFFTSINDGVKIQKLSISNGIAKVDFSDIIEAGAGGSCRVSAIRSQITNTLKQFSNVQEVIISVDGRVEDALQP